MYLRENLEHFENNLNVRIWIKYLNERQKSNTIRNATNEPTPNAPKRLKFKDARMSDLWNSRPALYFQRLWDFWDPTCFKPPSDSNTDLGQPTQIRRKRRCKFLIDHWKGGLTLVSTTFSLKRCDHAVAYGPWPMEPFLKFSLFSRLTLAAMAHMSHTIWPIW